MDDPCVALRRRLSEVVDGDAPAGERADLERHLDDCPPCESVERTLERVVVLVRASAEASGAPPAGLHERVMRHVRGAATR